ncbi:MAG: redoxin domain-containing protein [Verrucomicrobiales bacterium]|nr:redoxin domain-containing protein [Verrucomicrobiales bacterium]
MTPKTFRLSLLGLLFAATFTNASARTWTNQAGKTIEADFVSLNGDQLVLKGANGKTYEIPLASLSEADQTFAKEQGAASPSSPSASTSASASAGAPSVFKELIESKLVAVDGKRVSKYEMAEEPQYYAFYFSASWCGPCKAFTPKLISFYNESPGAKKTFEVVFMSRDNSEGDMEEYMTTDKMPWPAVRFRDADRIDEITKYRGRGIPCLVLVDRQGNVVSDSYVGDEYRGPTVVMEKMRELAQSTAAR